MSRVLVVDDEPDIVYVVRAILRSAGYDVTAAAGVDDALEQLSFDEPDLILLDLRLGDEEGWRFLDILHGDGRTGRIPVVIMSAFGGPENDARAAESGAKAFVTKPFVASELLETVQSHVATG
jgi:two-component system response regulator VicR